VNQRLVELRARRALLLEHAAQERGEVVRLVHAMGPPVKVAEWGLRALRILRSRPVVIGGAIALAAAAPSGRAVTWSLRAWNAWQAWQRLRGRSGRKR